MKNTFVEMNGIRNGEEVFNSIFCPKKENIADAIRTHLIDYFKDPNPGENDFVELAQQVIDKGGVTISVDDSDNFVKISFNSF